MSSTVTYLSGSALSNNDSKTLRLYSYTKELHKYTDPSAHQIIDIDSNRGSIDPMIVSRVPCFVFTQSGTKRLSFGEDAISKIGIYLDTYRRRYQEHMRKSATTSVPEYERPVVSRPSAPSHGYDSPAPGGDRSEKSLHDKELDGFFGPIAWTGEFKESEPSMSRRDYIIPAGDKMTSHRPEGENPLPASAFYY